MSKEISSFYWFWIPVVFMAVQVLLEAFVDGSVLSRMLSENGPHELLQAGLMVTSFFVALSYFFSSGYKTLILKLWFGLATLCCLYVAGEELSWGQQIWDWATPEFWTQVNDQQETNLHNTSSWLDQKPRLILEIGIVGGTLLFPLLKKFHWIRLPQNLDMLMPPKQLLTIALLVLIPQIIEKIFEAFDVNIFARFSEVQELYMFYFVLLYLVLLKRTARELKKS